MKHIADHQGDWLSPSGFWGFRQQVLTSCLSALTQQPRMTFITQYINKSPTIHHCQHWPDPQVENGSNRWRQLWVFEELRKDLPPNRQKAWRYRQQPEHQMNNLLLRQPTHLNSTVVPSWSQCGPRPQPPLSVFAFPRSVIQLTLRWAGWEKIHQGSGSNSTQIEGEY